MLLTTCRVAFYSHKSTVEFNQGAEWQLPGLTAEPRYNANDHNDNIRHVSAILWSYNPNPEILRAYASSSESLRLSQTNYCEPKGKWRVMQDNLGRWLIQL